MRYRFRDSAQSTSTGKRSGQRTVVTLDTDADRLSLKERLEARFAAEVNDYCGEKSKPDPKRTATRHGWRTVKVTVEGRQVQLSVQRMREVATGRAFYPPSFQQLVEEEERWREQVVMEYVTNAGGSTRTFGDFLKVLHLDDDVPGGRSRQAVSNVFQRISRTQLESLQTRRFDDIRFAAVMLDGIEVGHRTVLVGLGITTDGHKIALGVAEAQHEDGAMVAGMLRNVVERGADLSDVLWTIDGGDGLRDGIKQVFGSHAQIQNCILHKARRVRTKLPKLEWEGLEARLNSAFKPRYGRRVDTQVDNLIRDLQTAGEQKAANVLRRNRDQPLDTVHGAIKDTVSEDAWLGIRRRLHRAWAEPNHAVALHTLRTIAQELRQRRHPSNARSLETGMEETLTLTRLGEHDHGARRTLLSNNALESVNKDIRKMIKRHHARWRAGTDMRRRWVAVALIHASRSWNTVATPRALVALSARVAMARHPEVTMRIDPWMAGLRLTEIQALTGEVDKVEAALDDLVRFCDKHGKSLTVTARPDHDLDLQRLLTERGFTVDEAPQLDPSHPTLRMTRDPRASGTDTPHQAPTTEQPLEVTTPEPAPAAERSTPAETAVNDPSPPSGSLRDPSPLERYRHALGSPAAAQLGLRALTLGAYAARQSDAWLAQQAAALSAALTAPHLPPAHTARWMTDHADAAARVVALAQERARRAGTIAINPLDPWRSVIGDRRAELIHGRAVELGKPLRARLNALGKEADRFLRWHEHQLGDPFATLNQAAWQWVKANGDTAARHIAVTRELTHRRQLNLSVEHPRPSPAPAQAVGAVDELLAVHREHLGEQRTELIRAHAHAVTSVLVGVDRGQLRTWQATLEDPFAALDRDGAAQTRELEARHSLVSRQLTGARDRESASHASQHIADLRGRRAHLRAEGRDLDDWMIRHGDAASRALAAEAVLAMDKEIAVPDAGREVGRHQPSTPPHELVGVRAGQPAGGYER